MATASRMNWKAEETNKFIELLCEMKAKGKDTSYSKIREQMKSHGYLRRSNQQMKNHYDGWGRKIKVLDLLLSLTGVGWDLIKQLIVDDERWEEIVQVRMLCNLVDLITVYNFFFLVGNEWVIFWTFAFGYKITQVLKVTVPNLYTMRTSCDTCFLGSMLLVAWVLLWEWAPSRKSLLKWKAYELIVMKEEETAMNLTKEMTKR